MLIALVWTTIENNFMLWAWEWMYRVKLDFKEFWLNIINHQIFIFSTLCLYNQWNCKNLPCTIQLNLCVHNCRPIFYFILLSQLVPYVQLVLSLKSIPNGKVNRFLMGGKFPISFLKNNENSTFLLHLFVIMFHWNIVYANTYLATDQHTT